VLPSRSFKMVNEPLPCGFGFMNVILMHVDIGLDTSDLMSQM